MFPFASFGPTPNFFGSMNMLQLLPPRIPTSVPPVPKKRNRPKSKVEHDDKLDLDAFEGDGQGEYVPRPSKKRQSVRCKKYLSDETYDNQEERLFQQAVKNSRIDTCRRSYQVPAAPVFHPTAEEFQDPLAYIAKIRAEAEPFGACKIVPPPGWNPPCLIDETCNKKMPTKLQEIHRLQSGEGFGDGRSYTFAEYKAMALQFAQQWIERHGGCCDIETLERDYWDAVEAQTSQIRVEYANDLDTVKLFSGFPRTQGCYTEPAVSDMNDPQYYEQCGWNLNNLPAWSGSLLRHIKTPINGVNVPWLYMGMLFSSFCWHAEDNFLYSMNYSHFGASKQWYSVPGESAKAFEKTAQASLRMRFDEDTDLLHHMTMQISPSHLIKNKIPVYSIQQNEREFVITFPRAFHAGFNYGYNCHEAVNFAAADWLPWGMIAEDLYRDYRTLRPSVFSHGRLIFTLCQHLSELPKEYHEELRIQMMRMVDEDIILREKAAEKGVRGTSRIVRLPRNDFTRIDEAAADYDDKRMCEVCKAVCVFSAVGCECSSEKLTCLRHYSGLCYCPHERKYMLQWASDQELYDMKTRLDRILRPPVLQPRPLPQPFAFPQTHTNAFDPRPKQQQQQGQGQMPLWSSALALSSPQHSLAMYSFPHLRNIGASAGGLMAFGSFDRSLLALTQQQPNSLTNSFPGGAAAAAVHALIGSGNAASGLGLGLGLPSVSGLGSESTTS